MPVSRRSFLTTGAAAGAGLVAVGTTALPASATTTTTRAPHHGSGGGARHPHHGGGGSAYPGPLVADPAGLLALPEGFNYTLVSQSGVTELEGGGKTPERIDGTGAFDTGQFIRLVQNHEIGPKHGSDFPVPLVEGTVYDAGLVTAGGATVVELTKAGERVREWVGLSGTISNCAGGVTPWGTWLSCEESEDRAGTDYGDAGTAQVDHGFIFEVLPDGPERQDPRPIKAFGRMAHEAVVIQTDGRAAYLTEDTSTPNGLFYRWSAPRGTSLGRGSLHGLADDAGAFEAMAVTAPDGGHLDDLSRITSQFLGRELAVEWVTVPDRLAATTSVREQLGDDQITRSKKLEGAWADAGGVWFAASFAGEGDVPDGASYHDGQLWYYDWARQRLTLKLYLPYVPAIHADAADPIALRGTGVTLFDGPDNVHVSPFGGIVFAEDGEGDQHLVGFTEAGGAFALARNELNGSAQDEVSSFSEMTGPTFSPDQRFLFANIQEPGHTFAIRGDLRRCLST